MCVHVCYVRLSVMLQCRMLYMASVSSSAELSKHVEQACCLLNERWFIRCESHGHCSAFGNIKKADGPLGSQLQQLKDWPPSSPKHKSISSPAFQRCLPDLSAQGWPLESLQLCCSAGYAVMHVSEPWVSSLSRSLHLASLHWWHMRYLSIGCAKQPSAAGH